MGRAVREGNSNSSLETNAQLRYCFSLKRILILSLAVAGMSICVTAGNNRSAYIPYDNWMSGSEFRSIAFDAKHSFNGRGGRGASDR